MCCCRPLVLGPSPLLRTASRPSCNLLLLELSCTSALALWCSVLTATGAASVVSLCALPRKLLLHLL
jgi:hypothetical protein